MGKQSGNPGHAIEVRMMETVKLLSSFHEDNPRVHDLDGDVRSVAMSLLEAGWVEIGVAFNPEIGRLIGGHGRVMAANWLREQSPDWFDHQWEKWMGRGEPEKRKDLADVHKNRYTPSFWERCPVAVSNLDEKTHLAMMVRLNNSSVEGRDDPGRMARVLAKVKNDDLAGWETTTKKSFMDAFLARKAVIESDEQAAAQYQEKQYFERPDATDYSAGGNDGTEDAVAESGEVTSFQSTADLIERDGGVAEVGTDDIQEYWRTEGVRYDSSIRETRAVLLYSKEQLERFKNLAKPLAFILNQIGAGKIDYEGQSIRLWRPDAILCAVEYLIAQNRPLYEAFAAQNPKTTEEEAEDED